MHSNSTVIQYMGGPRKFRQGDDMGGGGSGQLFVKLLMHFTEDRTDLWTPQGRSVPEVIRKPLHVATG